MTIVEKIKQICSERNITIYRVEKDCNLSMGSIGKWEISSPKVDNLSKVADYFGVSLDYLAGREVKAPAPEQQADNTLSSNAAEMLKTFNQLSDDSQLMCIGYAEHMLRLETEKQQKAILNKEKRQKSK